MSSRGSEFFYSSINHRIRKEAIIMTFKDDMKRFEQVRRGEIEDERPSETDDSENAPASELAIFGELVVDTKELIEDFLTIDFTELRQREAQQWNTIIDGAWQLAVRTRETTSGNILAVTNIRNELKSRLRV
jgi:hypothetical protein